MTLIRHGESEYNYWRISSLKQLQLREMFKQDPGFVDSPLTKAGFKQVQQLAADWTLESRMECQVVITSPLCRAIDTSLMLFCDVAPSLMLSHSKSEKRLTLTQSTSSITTTTSIPGIASPYSDACPEAVTPCPKIVVTPLATEWLNTMGDTGLSLESLESKYRLYSDMIVWRIWKQHKQWAHNNWWFIGKLGPLQRMYRHVAPEPAAEVTRRVHQFEEFLMNRLEDNICIVGHSWFFRHWTGDTKMTNCERRQYDWDMDNNKLLRIFHD